jgi:type I restriction enzyme S subunit
VIDETEALVTRSLRRADLMRQAILKQAFEGRLVDQDPNDEPASALLERIRLERAALSITRQPSGRASVNSTAAEMTLGEASGY